MSLGIGQQRGVACDREAYLKESSINNYIHINFGQVPQSFLEKIRGGLIKFLHDASLGSNEAHFYPAELFARVLLNQK